MSEIILKRTGSPPLKVEIPPSASARNFSSQRTDSNRWYTLDLYEWRKIETIDDAMAEEIEPGYGGQPYAAVQLTYHSQWEREQPFHWASVGRADEIAKWLTSIDPVPPGVGFPRAPQYRERQELLVETLQRDYQAMLDQFLDAPEYALPADTTADTRHGLLDAEYLCELLDQFRPDDEQCRRILSEGGWHGMPKPGEEGWNRLSDDMPWDGLISRAICWAWKLAPEADDKLIAVVAQVLHQTATGWAAGYPVEDDPRYLRLQRLILGVAGGWTDGTIGVIPGRLTPEERRGITRAALALAELALRPVSAGE